MIDIIGVQFKKVGKVYFFDPCGFNVSIDQNVVVETVRGIELGKCVMTNTSVSEKKVVQPLKKVIRVATSEDLKKAETNKKKEKDAFDICQKKIEERKLVMKLIDVEYTFDNNKILFYFTADGRVDFRDLVKDLAAVFCTRIELRQIGVRDEAKMLGGLGICGKPFCCSTFLGEFQPVSIKMAKEQNLSLNPSKISGTCGRLMCCLKYEQEAYEDLLRITPKVDALVETPAGTGVVTETNILRGTIKVCMDSAPDLPAKAFHRSEIKIIKDSEIKIDKKEFEALSQLEDK